MTEQTSLVAQQVRLMQWAEQIKDCQNRPDGMDISTWCAQHNITKANYYYRLKRVRQMCLEQLPETAQPSFVELQQQPTVKPVSAAEMPVIRIKDPHGLSAEIYPSASPQILQCLVEAFRHAE